MKATNSLPHPDSGKLVKATLSDCCQSSVSFIPGKAAANKTYDPYHVCNKCRKPCTIQVKDYWIITDSGHYRKL